MLLHVTKPGKLERYIKLFFASRLTHFLPLSNLPNPKIRFTVSQFLKESAGWYFESLSNLISLGDSCPFLLFRIGQWFRSNFPISTQETCLHYSGPINSAVHWRITWDAWLPVAIEELAF